MPDFRYEGKEYSLPERTTFADIAELERAIGRSWSELTVAEISASKIWRALRTEHPTITLEDVLNFDVESIMTEDDESNPS